MRDCVCKHVCMCLYILMYIYVYMYVNVCIIYVLVCYVCVCMCVCLFVDMSICVCVCGITWEPLSLVYVPCVVLSSCLPDHLHCFPVMSVRLPCPQDTHSHFLMYLSTCPVLSPSPPCTGVTKSVSTPSTSGLLGAPRPAGWSYAHVSSGLL